MRIDEILAARRPIFSVEFFPPKTAEATEELFATARGAARAGARLRLGHLRRRRVDPRRHGRDHHGAQGRARLRDDGAPELRRRDAPRAWRRPSTGSRRRGSRTSSRCAATRRAGEDDFVQPEGGLGSAAELAAFISAGWDFAIGGACFPEVHPEAPDLETDLAYLKTKVDAGAELPDHPALLRQPGLLRLRRARRGRAGIDVPILAGVIPVASFAQTKRICELCDASIPAALEAAFEAAGGDERARVRAGRRLRGPAVRRAADRRRARASTSTRSTGRRRRGRCWARCGRRGRGSAVGGDAGALAEDV